MIIQIDEKADKFFDIVRGLMFRKKVKTILFVFPRSWRWEIHSCFVFFNFDAIYLNSDMEVTEIMENIKPFRLTLMPKDYAKYLIEAKAGFAKEKGIKIGEKIEISYPSRV